MMKQSNQITIQFWLVRPEGDRHSIAKMRKLGESGVFEPVFTSGQKMLLNMVARFDTDDHNATYAAALYAMSNAREIVKYDHPGGHIFGAEVWLNGQKMPSVNDPQFQ